MRFEDSPAKLSQCGGLAHRSKSLCVGNANTLGEDGSAVQYLWSIE